MAERVDNLEGQEYYDPLAGWVVSEDCEVTPTSAGIGDEVEIRGKFRNTTWLPAWATAQFFFDGVAIGEKVGLVRPKETVWTPMTYVIPTGTSEGNHECAVKEYAESWAERETAILTVVLPPPPDKGKLVIVSTPSGANVYINQAFRGRTPLILLLSEGEYDLLLTLGGYKDGEDRVRVVAGEVYELTYELEPVAEIPWKWIAGGVIAVSAVGITYYVVTRKPEWPEIAVERARSAYESARKRYETAAPAVKEAARVEMERARKAYERMRA